MKLYFLIFLFASAQLLGMQQQNNMITRSTPPPGFSKIYRLYLKSDEKHNNPSVVITQYALNKCHTLKTLQSDELPYLYLDLTQDDWAFIRKIGLVASNKIKKESNESLKKLVMFATYLEADKLHDACIKEIQERIADYPLRVKILAKPELVQKLFGLNHNQEKLIADKIVKNIWINGYTLDATNGGHIGSVNDIKFIPETMQFISCSTDTTMKLFDMSSGVPQCVYTWNHANNNGHGESVGRLAISNDGLLLASATQNTGCVRVHDIASRGCLMTGYFSKNKISKIRFNTSGTQIMASYPAANSVVWNVKTGQQEVGVNFADDLMEVMNSLGCRVTIPDDGWEAFIGTGYYIDQHVCIQRKIEGGDWVSKNIMNANNGGHTKEINNLTFSPDSKWLVSCSNDDTIKFFRQINVQTVAQALMCLKKYNNGNQAMNIARNSPEAAIYQSLLPAEQAYIGKLV